MPLASIDVDTISRTATPAETALTRRVDLTTLRLFVAVCDEQNLTRAAQREGIAASAVSKRMNDFELAFGVTIPTLRRVPLPSPTYQIRMPSLFEIFFGRLAKWFRQLREWRKRGLLKKAMAHKPSARLLRVSRQWIRACCYPRISRMRITLPTY